MNEEKTDYGTNSYGLVVVGAPDKGICKGLNEPRCEKTGIRGFRPGPTQTARAVQPQKMVRGLKFRIKVVEGLHYPYSENKGADQLCGYRTADLRLCFRL